MQATEDELVVFFDTVMPHMKGYYAARYLAEGAWLVHSYEPASANFLALEASARGWADWRVFHQAVGDHEGRTPLYLSDQSWAHTVVPTEGGATQSSQVALISQLPCICPSKHCSSSSAWPK